MAITYPSDDPFYLHGFFEKIPSNWRDGTRADFVHYMAAAKLEFDKLSYLSISSHLFRPSCQFYWNLNAHE